MKRFVDEDLTGTEFRECDLSRSRLIGVVMEDAEIDGLVTHLVVNGVEVMAYVEAELDRRHPVRLLIRSDDPADLLEAARELRADWTTTVERLRATPGIEHRSVNDEWSAVQTMRHLVFVHDSWFRRCCLGSTALFTPMGIGPAVEPYREAHGLDLSLDPTLEEVVAVREQQAAELEALARRGRARGAGGDGAGARRRRLAAVRPRTLGAPLPGHGAERDLRAPRFLRARPRPDRAVGGGLGSIGWR